MNTIRMMAAAALLVPFAGTALAEEKTLTVWMTDARATYMDWLQNNAESFREQHPDVRLEFVQMPPSDAYLRWPSAVAAGNAPDITWMFVAFAPWLHQMPGGGFVSMNDVVEDLGVDNFSETTKAAWRLDGEFLCVPVSRQTSYLFYRKDLFEEAGLQPPDTWDDVLEAAEALNRPSEGRFGIALAGRTDFQVRQAWETILYSNGGELIEADGTVVVNSPEAIEAAELYRQLFQFSPPGSLSSGYVEINRTFGQGTAAMVISLPVVMTQLLQGNPDLAGQVGAVIPSNIGNRETMQNYRGWCVFESSEHPEIAKDFIRHLFSAESYAEHLEAAQMSSLPVYNNEEAIDVFFTNNQTAQAFPEAHEYILNHETGYYAGVNRMGPNPHAGQINNEGVIERSLNAFLAGEFDAETAVERIHQDIERIMNQ